MERTREGRHPIQKNEILHLHAHFQPVHEHLGLLCQQDRPVQDEM